MKTDGEILRVDPIKNDPITGERIEPEEAPAVESFAIPIPVSLGSQAFAPDAAPSIGSMRGLVGRESTAGEVAQAVSTRCELCEHWRHEDWRRHLIAISETADGRKMIDALRGELLGRRDVLTVDPDDLRDVNMAILNDFGICAAFTESTREVTASPFYAGCPENDVRFKTRSLSDKRIASSGYDRVLRLAQGRKER